MFILSLNRKKLLVAASAIAAVIVIAGLCFMKKQPTPPDTVSAEGIGSFSTLARTPREEEIFLRNFGLTPVSESRSSEDITIPDNFGKAYEEYNRLQKKTGFDLSQYKGRAAKKIRYRIKNSDCIAEILTIDGRVAAAHLSRGIYGESYKAIDYGKTG